MEKALVTVVVPVYNVEKYLDRCVESIVNQTYHNLEIILVDDGSPDRCPQMCDEWEKKDYRIKVIHQDNEGVSAARNRGIDHATGAWITFVDSDDYVGEVLVENMIEALDRNPADYCTAGYIRYLESKNEMKPAVNTQFCWGTVCETIHNLFFLSPFAKLFSTDIIKEKEIRFDCRTRVGEDRAFIFDYLSCVERCLVAEDRSYIYRVREGSITNRMVWPNEKQHLWEHARRFWSSFANQEFILQSFRENHHLAHNILDSLLADVINAVIRNDAVAFQKLVEDPIARKILDNYKHKFAPKKEKILVWLLSRRMYLPCKVIIKLYYNELLHKWLKPIVRVMG